MTAGDVVITAELTDSETTREFLDTLPRTLTMNRYDDREYYGRIEALSENGESISDFENGDVSVFDAQWLKYSEFMYRYGVQDILTFLRVL